MHSSSREEKELGPLTASSYTESHVDRSIGIKKPKPLGDEGPSMTELSGYNSKRHEFDPELDERKCRKDFILERNLLYLDPLVKDLSPEERDIYQRYNVFMRYHSKEEHEELIRTVVEEHRIRKRIRDLQEARDAGCQTTTESERYLDQKRKKEAEENARKAKENVLPGPGGKLQQKMNRTKGEPDNSPRGSVKGSTGMELSVRDTFSTTAGHTIANPLDDWDMTGLPGSDLLSTMEQQLCSESRMLPSQYLKIQEVISIKIFEGIITKKSDAHRFFKVDSTKVDKVYDILTRKGIAQP
ncbi:hypothetical protein IFM89_034093 [Coptis chinensis]|uniref:SWIRM domain-containing protein n=1 Tax=Coptis chinensis TaxID=261450 RepID=A0A835H484_9MAGN|nr:hypothetical protein IFM89_034093 [Coptis chinensis]